MHFDEARKSTVAVLLHNDALLDRIRQRNYRVDKGGGLAYRRAAAQAVGVSPASL
jgi:hypothetical protein